jgi:transketolase
MGIRVIHVLTHDSIGVGEDGPTHQPVEQIAGLRAVPNLRVFRPADAVETAECWQIAMKSKNHPSALALTRQNLTTVRTEYNQKNLCELGAYTLAGNADAKVTIFASGSEVELAVAARATLEGKGVSARVVSVPCTELFFDQPEAYRKEVLGNSPVKIAVEAAVREGWDAFIGPEGTFIGMKGFGASGPAKKVFEHFGITADAVVAAAEAKL